MVKRERRWGLSAQRMWERVGFAEAGIRREPRPTIQYNVWVRVQLNSIHHIKRHASTCLIRPACMLWQGQWRCSPENAEVSKAVPLV